MVSPELIRRYPFFGGLTIDQIVSLAKVADEGTYGRDYYFHHEGDEINKMYLVIEGEVVIVSSLPQRDREIILNTLGIGDIFGWSSLVPPYTATASAKSVTESKVIGFNSKELEHQFHDDPIFGYLMMQKIAQIVRDRLNALRIETLSYQVG